MLKKRLSCILSGIVRIIADDAHQMLAAPVPGQIVVQAVQKLLSVVVGVVEQFKERRVGRGTVYAGSPRIFRFVQIVPGIAGKFRVDKAGGRQGAMQMFLGEAGKTPPHLGIGLEEDARLSQVKQDPVQRLSGYMITIRMPQRVKQAVGDSVPFFFGYIDEGFQVQLFRTHMVEPPEEQHVKIGLQTLIVEGTLQQFRMFLYIGGITPGYIRMSMGIQGIVAEEAGDISGADRAAFVVLKFHIVQHMADKRTGMFLVEYVAYVVGTPAGPAAEIIEKYVGPLKADPVRVGMGVDDILQMIGRQGMETAFAK